MLNIKNTMHESQIRFTFSKLWRKERSIWWERICRCGICLCFY